MKDEIAAKLNRELRQRIRTEGQVVYILVETRKLLERQGSLSSYPGLRLCCDWAVHPKLCGTDAQDILKEFDAYELEHQKSGAAVAGFEFERLLQFLSLTTFRTEFIESLSTYGVNAALLASDEFWQRFIQYYCGVIQDCPLEAKSQNTNLVSAVFAVAWPENCAEANFPGKRVIQWTWTLKNGPQREKFVCALI